MMRLSKRNRGIISITIAGLALSVLLDVIFHGFSSVVGFMIFMVISIITYTKYELKE